MNEALWYFAGLATPLVGLLLTLLWAWLTDKNYRIDCHRCGRSVGEIGADYKHITELKFWWHRRNGECQRNSN